MATPDPLAVRAYRLTVENAEQDAGRVLREIRKHVDALEGATSKDGVTALGEAQRLATDVAELIRYLSAIRALHEVEFLTKEKTNG